MLPAFAGAGFFSKRSDRMNTGAKTIAVVLLHAECDMRCMFCVTDDHVDVMTPAQFTELLELLKRRGFGNVVLGGGEPFCWPYGLRTAALAAKAAGMVVQVGTNGVAMPDDEAHADCVDRYVLPLDAAEPLVHNRLRPLAAVDGGHYELILGRLEQLRQRRRAVTVSTVISRANLDGIVRIGNYLADYVADGGRLHAWHLYRFIPAGRGGARHAECLDISAFEYNEAVQTARSQYYPFTIFKRPNMRHSATVDFFWREHGSLRIGSEYWRGEMDEVGYSWTAADSSL